ncbi:MAG: hypothetical protein ABSA97_07245 [Verrucomicrobiia bacterium]
MTKGRSGRSQWQKKTSGLSGKDLLASYKAEWVTGAKPPMEWEDLRRIISPDGDIKPYVADELVDLVRHLPIAHQSVSSCREQLSNLLGTQDAHVIVDFFIALDDARDLWGFRQKYFRLIPFRLRGSALHNAIHKFIAAYGREHTRREVIELWRKGDLSEEEKEEVVECSIGNYLFDWNSLPSLAPEAGDIARTLLKRGSLSVEHLSPTRQATHGSTPVTAPDPMVSKVQSLAEWAALPVRLTGSGLQSKELDRLQTTWLHPVLTALAFERFRRAVRHPMIEELLHMWAHEWPFPLHLTFQGINGGSGMPTLGVPLIRLLHMRLLLDTPSLASSLQQPESFLAPEIMLHLVRQEGVTYSPEMHLSPGSERGWRRRWAELTGEALSSLFLEDALALDLTTLMRIPETTNEETPDFLAHTFAGENIVFESKGATSWKTFGKSKRKALKQLAKAGNVTAWQQNVGWTSKSKGRCFACCLFATTGAETQPSQFHVEDPPFAFESYFHEGWEKIARQRHYTAVLQAAGLHENASAVAQGQSFGDEPSVMEGKDIVLPDGTIASFVGTRRRLYDLAATLGIREAGSLRGCEIFMGIDVEVRRSLANRQFPPGQPYGALAKENVSGSKIPPFGFLPSQTRREEPGVYSRLSNGSFLAVELKD